MNYPYLFNTYCTPALKYCTIPYKHVQLLSTEKNVYTFRKEQILSTLLGLLRIVNIDHIITSGPINPYKEIFQKITIEK